MPRIVIDTNDTEKQELIYKKICDAFGNHDPVTEECFVCENGWFTQGEDNVKELVKEVLFDTMAKYTENEG